VVIGTEWNDGGCPFAEDDVISMRRAPDTDGGVRINYTEDGTLSWSLTNRLRMAITGGGGTYVGMQLHVYASDAMETFRNYYPYNFKDFFNNDITWSRYAVLSFFDVSTTSYFSPAIYWKSGVFKSMTFISG
jgi:hypothetical protein